MNDFHFFCTAPRNAGDLLIREVDEHGGTEIHEQVNGVRFRGTLGTGYRLCLFSRIAGRVLLQIAHFACVSEAELYEYSRKVDWDDHLGVGDTFAIATTVAGTATFNRTGALLKVKDAIADYFMDTVGSRPSVDTASPDIRLSIFVAADHATLYLNLSGESLHRRGYRQTGGPAPLKENVAAAILLRAAWDQIAADGGALVDPMCGVGTIPLEGALIAGDFAPGLLRAGFGFEQWKQHDQSLWKVALREAEERRQAGADKIPAIFGYDKNRHSIHEALRSAHAMGISGSLHFEKRDMTTVTPPSKVLSKGRYSGLIATNPPYGVRMGTKQDLTPLYRSLGQVLKTSFSGWKSAIFTADKELSLATKLRAEKLNTLYNGSIPCVLAQSELFDVDVGTQSVGKKEIYEEQFGNRLKKNYKKIKKWAVESDISCYRVYDADMPEFAAAIDLYENKWAHVQEYAPPKTVDRRQAELRLQVILDVVPDVLGISRKDIFVKTRERQRAGRQYQAMGGSGVFHEIREGGLSFLANFTDYLDTGIFLDHRITREMIRNMSDGRTFLNLFSYTASATVYAISGGAAKTVSVDNSNTYTEWARENMNINGFFNPRHELIKDEARSWLTRGKSRYQLIFLDPPTFSRSKSFKKTFQIQYDHIDLISMALDRLSSDGTLLFSTNYQQFKLDSELLKGAKLRNLTQETIPVDFTRNRRIHQLFSISFEPGH